jgi:hypothetical protein
MKESLKSLTAVAGLAAGILLEYFDSAQRIAPESSYAVT